MVKQQLMFTFLCLPNFVFYSAIWSEKAFQNSTFSLMNQWLWPWNLSVSPENRIWIFIWPCRWLSDLQKICLQCRRRRFSPWVGKIPWKRKLQLTPLFLTGKSHGLRSLAGYNPRGHKRVRHNLGTKQQQHLLDSSQHILVIIPITKKCDQWSRRSNWN